MALRSFSLTPMLICTLPLGAGLKPGAGLVFLAMEAPLWFCGSLSARHRCTQTKGQAGARAGPVSGHPAHPFERAGIDGVAQGGDSLVAGEGAPPCQYHTARGDGVGEADVAHMRLLVLR